MALVVLVTFEPQWFVGLDRAVGQPAYRLTYGSETLRRWWAFDASAQRPDLSRIALVVVAALLWRRGRRWAAAWVAASALVSVVASPLLKVLVDRPRPGWPDPIIVLGDPSFPSGHATAAWVFATAVVLLCWDHEVPPRWQRSLMVVSIGAAVVVSLDRVFLGVHYPSDVVGGALLGVLVALASQVAVGGVERTVRRQRTGDRAGQTDE